jgi:SulP family sulfate permease
MGSVYNTKGKTSPLPSKAWYVFVPKLFSTLSNYSLTLFKSDLIAAATVSVVGLPLAMALAIASGVSPEKGIITAIIAGFLISLLGGSRYQIGGPTGAFVAVIFNIIQKYGYEGLVIASLMAGVMLILFGLLRLGTIIKYIPSPLITGFTAGIGLIIFTSQIKDLLGLRLESIPTGFISKISTCINHCHECDPYAIGLAFLSLITIIGIRYLRPAIPSFLIALLMSSGFVYAFSLPVETIGSKFGDISLSFELFHVPELSWGLFAKLFPSAFTIAFLAGIESLLSAVVADSITGTKHRSNCELVAQGFANIGCVLFGGIPATGAVARTATNVKAGAKTPMAGIMHAIFLLLLASLFAPLAKWIPLSALAAILIVIAWNMSEIDRFKYFLKGPKSDSAVLILTFLLTIFIDITVAFVVGMAIALLLFARRMIEIQEERLQKEILEGDRYDVLETSDILSVPEDTQVIHLSSPLFFGIASLLKEILERLSATPRVIILEMQAVPFMDATAMYALESFIEKAHKEKKKVILCALNSRVLKVLSRMGINQPSYQVNVVANLKEALVLAKKK